MTQKAYDRYEPAKRMVPFRMYAPISFVILALWLWLERGHPAIFTIVLVALGVVSLSHSIGRFILDEQAVARDRKRIRG